MDIKIGGHQQAVDEQALEAGQDGTHGNLAQDAGSRLNRPRAEISPFAPSSCRSSPRGQDRRGQSDPEAQNGPGHPGAVGLPDRHRRRRHHHHQRARQTRRSATPAGRSRVSPPCPRSAGLTPGKVVSIKEFGRVHRIPRTGRPLQRLRAFRDTFVKNVNDVVKEGEVVTVKLIAVDDQGRIKLSRKAAIMEARGEKYEVEAEGPPRRRSSASQVTAGGCRLNAGAFREFHGHGWRSFNERGQSEVV